MIHLKLNGREKMTASRRILIASIGALVCLSAIGQSNADVSVTVIPSLAPNAYGSPSWSDYVSNATLGIENGGVSEGTGAAQYTPLPNGASFNWEEAVVTGFPSWMGVAAPNTPAYSGEYGNRLTFGLDVKGNGQPISISQLGFEGDSSDPGDVLQWSWATGSFDYSTDYVGIIYGVGGAGDIADYTYVTSGLNTQPVDEIISRGTGNSLPAYEEADAIANFGYDPYSAPDISDQQRIDETASVFGLTSDFSVTGVYTMGNDISGSATVNETGVPEPASFSLVGIGALSLLRRRRRA